MISDGGVIVRAAAASAAGVEAVASALKPCCVLKFCQLLKPKRIVQVLCGAQGSNDNAFGSTRKLVSESLGLYILVHVDVANAGDIAPCWASRGPFFLK